MFSNSRVKYSPAWPQTPICTILINALEESPLPITRLGGEFVFWVCVPFLANVRKPGTQKYRKARRFMCFLPTVLQLSSLSSILRVQCSIRPVLPRLNVLNPY